MLFNFPLLLMKLVLLLVEIDVVLLPNSVKLELDNVDCMANGAAVVALLLDAGDAVFVNVPNEKLAKLLLLVNSPLDGAALKLLMPIMLDVFFSAVVVGVVAIADDVIANGDDDVGHFSNPLIGSLNV